MSDGYEPKGRIEPDPERVHECMHAEGHKCSCSIQRDHLFDEWLDNLPEETR